MDEHEQPGVESLAGQFPESCVLGRDCRRDRDSGHALRGEDDVAGSTVNHAS